MLLYRRSLKNLANFEIWKIVLNIKGLSKKHILHMRSQYEGSVKWFHWPLHWTLHGTTHIVTRTWSVTTGPWFIILMSIVLEMYYSDSHLTIIIQTDWPMSAIHSWGWHQYTALHTKISSYLINIIYIKVC